MSQHRPKVGLVQDGARGHYGLALALQNAHLLEVMYTDFFVRNSGFWHLAAPIIRSLGGGAAKRMLDRRCPELDGSHVKTNLAMRIRQQRARRRIPARDAYFRWQSADTGKWIAKSLPADLDVLIGFIRNLDPELCAVAQRRGIKTVGDQMIAPAFIEKRELAIQQERFPGWQAPEDQYYDNWIKLESETWSVLDAITCPSEYVAQGLVEGGIEPARVHVINYPVDESMFQFHDRSGAGNTLNVGFVGQIGLRKGAPYFLQAAKRFHGRNVRFTMIGESALSDSANAELRQHVTLLAVPRSQVTGWLHTFDLIYFPTTCEGSAYALMEAMATGLPVVTSPNSGTVARHGKEGFLCAYDDIEAACAHIDRLLADPRLRREMGRAAADRYKEFNLAHYSTLLARLVESLTAAPGAN